MMYNLSIKILMVTCLSLLSISNSFSQNSPFNTNEIDSIFRSRGYSSWKNEKDGIIEFEKKITKKITRDDIINSQKYYGCKCDKDTRLTEEDLGTEYKVRKRGLTTYETLEELIPAEFDYFDNRFTDNKVLAIKDNNYFLFNRIGQEVNQELIKDYIYIDGLCSQDFNEYDCDFRRVKDKFGKWGYINQNWKIVIPCIYDDLSLMRRGYSTGKLNGKIGIINNSGNFNQINGQSIDYFPVSGMMYTIYTSNNKKGVIDNNAKIIINPKYDNIRLEGNYILVKLNNKWGVINELDSVIVPIKYVDIIKFLDDISVKLHKDSNFISYKTLQENARIAEEKKEEARRITQNRIIESKLKESESTTEIIKNENQNSNNNYYTNSDCVKMVEDINKKRNKNINYTAKTWIDNILLPCFANSIKSVLRRNNIVISSSEDKVFNSIFSDARDCLANALSSTYDNATVLSLVNSLFNNVFSGVKNSSSSTQSRINNNSKTNNKSNSVNKCPECCKKQEKIRHKNSDGTYYWDNEGEMRVGWVHCRGCYGSGMSVYTNETNVCADCRGKGWIQCKKCKGLGYIQ